jgi:hypothetical protein
MTNASGQVLAFNDVDGLISALETEYAQVMTFTAAAGPGRTNDCPTHSFQQTSTFDSCCKLQ